MSRFSRTVMRAKQRRPSGACEMPSLTMSAVGVRVMFSPWKRMSPVRGGVSPEIDRSVVDLPAPLEPISVTHSPASTVSEMPLSASMLP
jgi:hypothetical protein